MDEEPLTKLGMRTYSVHKWELREGRIAIDLSFRARTLALGSISRMRCAGSGHRSDFRTAEGRQSRSALHVARLPPKA